MLWGRDGGGLDVVLKDFSATAVAMLGARAGPAPADVGRDEG
jgi:hypothetical protein